VLAATIAATLTAGGYGAAPPPDGPTAPEPAATVVYVRPTIVVSTYKGRTAQQWAKRYRQQTRRLQNVRRHIRVRWQPTVTYALRLASAVTGVPYGELSAVSYCESHHYPFATNGRYKGIFQLGWSPFGFSPFDPVANALSAALTVQHDGGWRQWSCKP